LKLNSVFGPKVVVIAHIRRTGSVGNQKRCSFVEIVSAFPNVENVTALPTPRADVTCVFAF